jgi:hypothetical protein
LLHKGLPCPPAAALLLCITGHGLPVVEAPENETITVAVSADDLEAGDKKNPERHPVAIALRRQRGVDDARLSKPKF